MKRASLLLIIILLIALFLRVFNMGTNPPAVYGDEISFAWNAWSVLKTGHDEHGVFLPLQFRAFDDYKSPIPVYLLVPIFALFGMNEWSVRLPVALVSVLTVWITYLFVQELFRNPLLYTRLTKQLKPHQIDTLSLISAILLAISPWHIHLSRGYFEATLALLPFVGGIYMFLKGLRSPRFLFFSTISFVVSLYTYFTPRIVVPLMIFGLVLFFRKTVMQHKKYVLISAVVFTLLCLPLVKLTFFDQGSNRMQWFIRQRMEKAVLESTIELGQSGGPEVIKKLLHNRYSVLVRNIGTDYLEHFSLNFWYLYGDNSLRYFLGKMGMFHIIELPFLLIGFYFLMREQPKVAALLLMWILIAPIPAAIAGRSFAVRSLALLPAPFIFISYGIYHTGLFLKTRSLFQARIYGYVLLVLFAISSGAYTLRYHFDYPLYGATWWGWENKAALDYAKQHEKEFDQIIISNYYTGLPLALAFYTEMDPTLYRTQRDKPSFLADQKSMFQYGKYYIGSLDVNAERIEKGVIPAKTLYIGGPFENGGTETITAPDDGRVLFNIFEKR